jgi:hypothetical protein
MANEFKKISSKEETRYVLENASGGATSSGAVASVAMPMGGTRKRGSNLIAQEGDKPSKPKNPVAKAAQKVAKGSGKHKNPKTTIPRKEKHKKDPYSESLEQALETSLEEGGYDYHKPDPHWITIDGKRWKKTFNRVQAQKAVETLNRKFKLQGSTKIADYEPADPEEEPDWGIKVGESALDKFRQGAAEREKKHDKIEADRKSAAAQGKTDVKGAVDRLEKQVNAKEAMLPKSAFAGSSKNKLGTAGQWRNKGPKANKPAKAGDLVGGSAESIQREGDEYNEYSDEVDMVKNNLHTIVRCCKELAKALKPGENLPEWIEEKISMSKQNVVTALDYMLSQHEQGHVYDEDHSTATGGWGQAARPAIDVSSKLIGNGHDDRTMESDDYFNRLKETLEAAVDERSKSQAQWNLMHAVAHDPAFAKKVGVKQSVGKEFSAADAGHNPKSLPKRVVPKKKK